MNDLLAEVARRSAAYLESLPGRRVAPAAESVARLGELGGAVPEGPSDPAAVIRLLDDVGSPATVASTGGRYFGFVIGGALPATLAANWLAGAWDQNAGYTVMSPVAAALEAIALGWLREIIGLPAGCGAGFVTGATTANFACLAAARTALLSRAGWNVEDHGLYGAPELTVVVGGEVHVSALKALAMLGLGRARVTRVPVDDQGRMRVDALPALDGRTIVCIQAGNVNSGAFDPAGEICERARTRRGVGACGWRVRVVGSGGARRRHLFESFLAADSWAVDCHKWLNVPYDSGLAFVREPAHLQQAMALSAAYLPKDNVREPANFTPEASRRARGVEIWAALRSLGRSGLAEMVERSCDLAARFADGLSRAGFPVLNEVVLNQVLVSFGDPAETRRVIAEVQRDGTCWCGGTEWQGHTAMRVSVSCYQTTEEDIDRSVAAVVRIARARGGSISDSAHRP